MLKDLIDVDVRVAAVQYLSKFNAFFHDFLYFLLEFLVNKSVMTLHVLIMKEIEELMIFPSSYVHLISH